MNVLIALVDERHSHHRRALDWLTRNVEEGLGDLSHNAEWMSADTVAAEVFKPNEYNAGDRWSA